VLVDAGKPIADSWAIAAYLEETYPNRPSLFGGPGGLAVTRFVNAWTDRVMGPGIAALIICDILERLDEGDKPYFRASREKAFGKTLEDVMADRDARVVSFRQALEPLRTVLRAQPFVGGDAPAYGDYIPFGNLQWARCISPFPLLTADDPILAWRDRLLDLFGGLARNVPAYD
jgi:glutathione S-transferase